MQNPGESFLRAAKMGLEDDLRGTAEALSWGKIPSVGTGFQFDILYSGKVFGNFLLKDIKCNGE